ncbi:hypothetical protein [Burkholderia plantarii]|uniref:hypothetical protein n=1 Tax=Burkholderia plantarii TaxID=41899 RepID=UPI0018DB2FEE|nr:hypothetical protein [Burkholderia plantarii]MBI0326732.1 hypothetical protein [Burkholderia plantarii]
MTTPNFEVLVHVHDLGDITVGPDQYAGARGKDKTLEGFQIRFPDATGIGLRYMAHVAETGDTGWRVDGEFVGSRGRNAPVQGFAITLTGERSTEYDVVYKAYQHGGGETAWCANGAFCGTRGQARNLDAIVVKLVPKFAVRVHVPGVGDVTAGPNQAAGAPDKGLPLSGFQIRLAATSGLSLQYMAHLSGKGDTGWVKDGEFIGSEDGRPSVEGFAIRLSGDHCADYDVFYRAHDTRGSETAWCANGAFCGTRGQSRPLDAITVKLVRKFSVLVHVQHLGDITVGPNEYAGARGGGKAIEGFQIRFAAPVGLGLRYMAHVTGKGDTGWVKDGEFVGTRGQKATIQGFAIELTGENFTRYDIFYMAYRQGGGETAWCSNGEFCGSRDIASKFDAIVVKLVKRAPNYVSIVSKARAASGRMLLITGHPAQGNVTVDVHGDENWQTWDQRLVPNRSGFFLISKADPTRCIARRGNREPVALADIRSTKLEDCIWRNDTVPGLYNAINCLSDWELKLNMHRLASYPDHGNVLQIFNWDNASEYELWRTTTQRYDVVAGGDEHALNSVAEAIYRGCYPRVFKASIDVDREGLTRVGFDMRTAPVFKLVPPALRPRQQEQAGLSAGQQALQEQAEAASFSASVAQVRLTAGGALAAELDARLEAAATVRFDHHHNLMIHLDRGELQIAAGQIDEPLRTVLELALNHAFLPLLLDYLNREILGRIAIPALDLNGVQFASPVVAVQPPYLLGSTCMMPDAAVTPPPSGWPRGRLFCGVDTPTLDAVATTFLKNISVRDRWSCDLGITTVSAEYWLTFTQPRFQVTAGAGNRYRLSIGVDGGAKLAASTFLGDVGFTASANGSVQAEASIEITPERKVKIVFRALNDVDIHWHFHGLPVIVDAGALLGVFNPVIREAVTAALRGLTFDVYTIPEIRTVIGGKEVTITLQGLGLDSMQDAARKALVVAAGEVEVRLG